MSIRSNIIGQFKNPHGPLGQLAGYIMAYRASNIERNAWTLELLELSPDDRLLELGFGPGIGIEMAAKVITKGLIVGVDHSKTMLLQTRKRNTDSIKCGRVQLLHGDAQNLTELDMTFSKIWSANAVQFWDDPIAVFTRLRDLLDTEGTIATTYMPRHRGATDNDAHRKAADITHCMQQAGYTEISKHVNPMKPVCAICVLGRRPLS